MTTRADIERMKTRSELAGLVNFQIGKAITHPLLPADAKEALSLAGALLMRLSADVDSLLNSGVQR